MKPHFVYTECGVRPSFRIQRVIGGHAARPHSWPWQADIQYMNSTGYWKHKCGASLVHPQWVVTAAHCLTVRPDSRIRIVLGFVFNFTFKYYLIIYFANVIPNV